MKRTIGLVLATGLALLIAGCSTESTSGGDAAAAAVPRQRLRQARGDNC